MAAFVIAGHRYLNRPWRYRHHAHYRHYTEEQLVKRFQFPLHAIEYIQGFIEDKLTEKFPKVHIKMAVLACLRYLFKTYIM